MKKPELVLAQIDAHFKFRYTCSKCGKQEDGFYSQTRDFHAQTGAEFMRRLQDVAERTDMTRIHPMYWVYANGKYYCKECKE